ncbi:MAG: penicillin-binding protein [Parasporobacterium sp.]|nr:penicillin-binding protein [Parasporobacterium sp.]
MIIRLWNRIKRIYEVFRDFCIKMITSRVFLLGAVFIIMFCVIIARLFYLQIIKAEYYQDNFTQKARKVIYSEGARGNIYDSAGELLAHNEVGYSVVMTDEIKNSDMKGEIINRIIFNTIELIESNGDSLINNFNIEYRDGEAAFKSEPATPMITFLCNVFGLRSTDIYDKGYDKYSARQIIDYMCSPRRFDISADEYNLEQRIKICTVRYALSLNSYQKYLSTVIASDVNEYTQAAIMENKSDLTGVDIKETYKRVYDRGVYYGSILGYTGYISESELDSMNYNDLGIEYLSGDIVGKTGIEASYDEYLKGTRGTETVFVDNKGSVLEVIDSTRSGSGNDLYLTLDTNLQIAFYEILEREIAGLLVARIVDWNYVSDGTDDIVYIPANDVYFQLLTNVIEPLDFSNPGATYRERSVYSAFLAREKAVLQEMRAQLVSVQPKPTGELSDEFNDYMYFAYNLLGSLGILDKEVMNTSDPVYLQFADEAVSLREFLIHAISENWINVTMLDSSKRYATSEEIYNSLLEKLMSSLTDSVSFQERIYYYMVYSGEISPYDICMMLYDQNKLPSNDPMMVALQTMSISPFQFIITQIENLVITPAMVALDPCSASIVVTDTKTGKVKALVSYPSYDNNMLSGSINQDYWYQLNTDGSAPLYNRATQALTAPGSTFKPITAAAGLNENVINVDTFILDEGVFEEITPSPKCWIHPDSHGYVNVTEALTVSCNYFFYSVGYGLSMVDDEYTSLQGLDILEQYATDLGLNMKSGVEIEENNPRFSSTDSVRTAIGQGTNGFATVQLARYANCLANTGRNYQLSLIDRVVDKAGNTILTVEPFVNNEVELRAGSWNAIHAGMLGVVTEGSVADVFKGSGIELAGKTGTAQESIYRSNHSNFIGFSPYYNPEIAFACTIRNGGSSTYAAETTKACLEYYYGKTTINGILSSGAYEIELMGVTD